MQFGGLKALNNVDLSIKRDTIHGLIGPSGSGKSTMMNVLTGIYKPTTGNVLYAGETVVGKTSSDIALSDIARTFQNVQLFGEMTAIPTHGPAAKPKDDPAVKAAYLGGAGGH